MNKTQLAGKRYREKTKKKIKKQIRLNNKLHKKQIIKVRKV